MCDSVACCSQALYMVGPFCCRRKSVHWFTGNERQNARPMRDKFQRSSATNERREKQRDLPGRGTPTSRRRTSHAPPTRHTLRSGDHRQLSSLFVVDRCVDVQRLPYRISATIPIYLSYHVQPSQSHISSLEEFGDQAFERIVYSSQ